jgi:hypothetical protein
VLPLELVLDALPGTARRSGGQFLARCPAHEDRQPSLAVRELDDGRVLLRCHAGCSTDDVLDAVGLAYRDLFPDR